MRRAARRPRLCALLGVPALKEAIATRYGEVYDVHLDAAREVAVLPGTKTGLMEFALCAVESGGTIVLPDPGYPDYFSAVALAGAEHVPFSGFDTKADAMYLNFPSNPTAATVPEGLFDEQSRGPSAARPGSCTTSPTATSSSTDDGRRASSQSRERARLGSSCSACRRPTAWPGGVSGSRLGTRSSCAGSSFYRTMHSLGIFRPIQEAGIAALTGPQDSVEERRATYERRRDLALGALAGIEPQSEGTFFVWFRLPEGVTVDHLLVEQRVALAPGEGFGARGAGWARLSLAVNDELLDRGLERLHAAFA